MLAYQLGDEHAFMELYGRYANKIFGYLRSKLRNTAQASDVFQSTYLKLHKSKHLYNSSLAFSPWIFTICRSELMDFFRKQKVTFENFEEEKHGALTESTIELPEVSLKQLSKEQQTALTLRYYNDATFEEIASALGTTPTNARQIVSRSIKYLRGFYEKQ